MFLSFSMIFFFNDTATTEIYTLSLHDALPISARAVAITWSAARNVAPGAKTRRPTRNTLSGAGSHVPRSEEHTTALQSHSDLVCRLLLQKKKKKEKKKTTIKTRRTYEKE